MPYMAWYSSGNVAPNGQRHLDGRLGAVQQDQDRDERHRQDRPQEVDDRPGQQGIEPGGADGEPGRHRDDGGDGHPRAQESSVSSTASTRAAVVTRSTRAAKISLNGGRPTREQARRGATSSAASTAATPMAGRAIASAHLRRRPGPHASMLLAISPPVGHQAVEHHCSPKASRSSCFRTLPAPLLGEELSAKTTDHRAAAACQPAFEVVEQVAVEALGRRPLPGHHDGPAHLAQRSSGTPITAHSATPGWRRACLDLGRIDVLAPRDDHVLHPVDDRDVPSSSTTATSPERNHSPSITSAVASGRFQ